jgi:hypothetical protein
MPPLLHQLRRELFGGGSRAGSGSGASGGGGAIKAGAISAGGATGKAVEILTEEEAMRRQLARDVGCLKVRRRMKTKWAGAVVPWGGEGGWGGRAGRRLPQGGHELC